MQPALLALEDGSLFKGISIGAEGLTTGEVVFNTSMTGYQEILTDPSYAQQIVTLTYPHIGNTGTNSEDQESTDIWVTGLVIRDLTLVTSSWRNEQSLSAYLKKRGIIAIAEVDTRRLTRLLREKGALNGCIMAGAHTDESVAFETIKSFKGIKGTDLAKEVSTKKAYEWTQGTWDIDNNQKDTIAKASPLHVVVYDFGIKLNILRYLVDNGCKVTVVPAQTTAEEALALNPNGILLSNGPGDPAPCDYAISAIQTFLSKKIPLFGICLGHQLLGLACGAQTVKMKFGHHGANHPVQDLRTKKVIITSQNHGFSVDKESLPSNIDITHISLFDGTLQGISHKEAPAFSFQGHPEASPGPHDLADLFQSFVDLMRQQ
ncbi:MAG: carbamoyl phosphate synthase small subunit [Gammaproteobacteria bacterium]|jgi:carbamoyl-phosphate synthase small subunit|nr:carbamoyl phosphate synthase small subunit [Gammaproteobacteria bacterium]